VFIFFVDEEVGGVLGSHWLVQNRRDLIDGVTEAVSEVGGFSVTMDGASGDPVRLYLLQTAEKGIAWLRLRAIGTAGHGSMRNADNAVTAIAEAVAAIGRHDWPIRITSTMRTLFDQVEQLTGVHIDETNVQQVLDGLGPASRMLSAVIRNTANPTMMDSGYKVNVIPGEATASVDGRFLPGHEDEFFTTLRELLPAQVTYELLHHDDALETTFDGHLVDAMRSSLLDEDPDAAVLPYLMSGGTDAKAWNRIGVRCFGFTPLRLPPDLDFTGLFHGIDERVPTDALEFSARVFDRFLDRA
jgi:acetylornithine deacetylase/succinyl-diaminopimelate desuccinylase-like protein